MHRKFKYNVLNCIDISMCQNFTVVYTHNMMKTNTTNRLNVFFSIEVERKTESKRIITTYTESHET